MRETFADFPFAERVEQTPVTKGLRGGLFHCLGRIGLGPRLNRTTKTKATNKCQLCGTNRLTHFQSSYACNAPSG